MSAFNAPQEPGTPERFGHQQDQQKRTKPVSDRPLSATGPERLDRELPPGQSRNQDGKGEGRYRQAESVLIHRHIRNSPNWARSGMGALRQALRARPSTSRV